MSDLDVVSYIGFKYQENVMRLIKRSNQALRVPVLLATQCSGGVEGEAPQTAVWHYCSGAREAGGEASTSCCKLECHWEVVLRTLQNLDSTNLE